MFFVNLTTTYRYRAIVIKVGLKPTSPQSVAKKMNNQETREYLAQYPQEQLEIVLDQLGYTMDADEFPEKIIEDVEAVLESMGVAVERHKQLQASQETKGASEPKSQALAVQETAEIAAELLDVRNIQVDPKVLFAVAQCAINDTKAQAAALNKLCRETLVAELRKGQQEMADDLLEVVKAKSQSTAKLFSEGNLRKMVDSAVPAYEPRFDVDEFIQEVKTTSAATTAKAGVQAQAGNEARAVKPEFDLDAFLGEVWG